MNALLTIVMSLLMAVVLAIGLIGVLALILVVDGWIQRFRQEPPELLGARVLPLSHPQCRLPGSPVGVSPEGAQRPKERGGRSFTYPTVLVLRVREPLEAISLHRPQVGAARMATAAAVASTCGGTS